MILPTKHLAEDRALLSVGAALLRRLRQPTTVSALWNQSRTLRTEEGGGALSYDWFILALDLLFILGAIEIDRGLLRRTAR